MTISKGKYVSIQSYKHDHKLHRVWRKTMIVEISENHLVTAHNQTCVIEDDGRKWYTREPAICYFFKDYWFNVIAMKKKDGIYFYCNLSSPFLVDHEGIKYIDYDLDVKIFPDRTYQFLDENEFLFHSESMNYSADLIQIIREQFDVLVQKIKDADYPFDEKFIDQSFVEYEWLLHKKKHKG